MNAMRKQLDEMESSIKSLKESMTSVEKKMGTLRTENSFPHLTELTEEKIKTFDERIQTIEKSNEDKTRRIVELESAVKQLQEKENKRKNEVKIKVIRFFKRIVEEINLFLNIRYHPKKKNPTESEKELTTSFQKSLFLAFQASSALNILWSGFFGSPLF